MGNEIKPVDSSIPLQNSQCAIGATSVTTTALSTTITLDITFKSVFTGLKNIFMYAADGDGSINTGWVQKGTYTVAVVGPPVPAADSVSPSSGGGFLQTFTFVFSDSQSSANLAAAGDAVRSCASCREFLLRRVRPESRIHPAGVGQRHGRRNQTRGLVRYAAK